MEKDNIKTVMDRILNEKIQLLLNRIDAFQNHLLREIENLKQLDELVQYEIPDGLLGQRTGSESDEVAQIHNYVKKMASAANQLALISALLEGINRFCNRAALFLLRDDKLVGWKGRGFAGVGDEISDEELNKVFFSLSANTIFRRVLENRSGYQGNAVSQPDDFLIFNRLGGKKPELILVLPFFVKGKPQAVIYCDAFKGKTIQRLPIETLAAVGELSLDLLPLRQKIMTRVKTQEFIGGGETESKHEITSIEGFDELEKTSTSLKENDPERLARVIVNDVILYNQKVIEDGIRNKNLYDVLKETLLQAKEIYLRKFNDLKYFDTQLIQTLARGDKKVLKGYNFEVFK